MAISKRVRFEILRRDNHACRYCGATAPEVKLTVDHVVPVALGGSDDPSNLVTACAPCNSGKSSTSPDSTHVADVNLKALIWANAMEQAAEERAAQHLQQATVLSDFKAHWDGWHWTDKLGNSRTIDIPDGWPSSVRQFLAAGLTLRDLCELVDAAMNARTTDEWRYFCGCCWRRIREAQERAAVIVSEWEGQGAS